MRARLLLVSFLVFAASCGGNGAVAPSAGSPPAVPVDPGTPANGGVDPADAGAADGLVRSMADALSLGERRGRVEDQLDDATLMASSVALRYRARFVDGYPGLIEFTLNNTGSGWQEKFLLQIPPVAPTSPVPLLVVFHKYGSGHGDVLNTSFLAETQARGWYCLSPLGARQKHFGNRESQINTRAALDLVAHLFPIDRNRVYGAGFSMGGGALANYAARHLDPAGVRFAAICDHTGGVSLSHTWFSEPDDADLDDNVPLAGQNLEVPDVLESLFGGTPSAVPFEYQRCSTIDLDPIGGTIGAGTDFGRNLVHIPTLVWIANADPLVYLGTQTYAFDGYLQAQNAGHQLTVASGNVHAWTTLDETAVCDWLQTKTLQTPNGGRTLADEDGTWFRFQIEQDAPGSFTPFTWSIDTVARRVDISQTANLRRISIDAPGAGLVLSGNVTLRLATADGTGDRARILGVLTPPLAVTRDGVAASGTYDAFSRTYEVVETNAALHTWVLTFP
ncbi:MAG: hypothetical protein NTY35_11925 [Planctomycetota bacterium]|nr:hypothetical protein [Planctomycetota bacterium]